MEKKTKQEQREERRARVLAAMQSPTAIRVAIDMGLGDAMNRKEIVKLSDQIRRLYGANLRAQVTLRYGDCICFCFGCAV